MKKASKIIISAILIIVLIFQLAFLYYVKYKNQGLLLSEFSLLNIGNLFNLITILVIIFGLIVHAFLRSNGKKLTWASLFTSILTIILSAAYYSTLISLPFQKIYLLGQNGNKLFIGLLFIVYLLASFLFASYIWLIIFGRNSLILIRSLLNSTIVIFLLILFAFYYVSVADPQIDNDKLIGNEDNVAVVLGAAVWSQNQPSPILAARVEKALQLMDSSMVGKIYFTGSNAPGELSEAEVAYNYALELQADSSKLLFEKNTISTNEQIHYIRKKLLPKKNISDVIIISDEFHLVRIEEISKFNNIKIYAVPSDLNLSFESGLYNRLRESIGLIFFWFFAI